MPELPFLEVLVENLASSIVGRRIERLDIHQPALLQTAAPSPESFAGEFLSLPTRRGKYVILETESRRALVFHLMRLGRLQVTMPADGAAKGAKGKAPAARPKGLSARLRLDDGTELRLVEHGTEKRARLWLAEELDDVAEVGPGRIGPDPTRGELTLEGFRAAVRAESRQLKSLLVDQRALSGVGNGLSDEILHEAKLSPLALTGKSSDEEIDRLHAALLAVLERQTTLLRESMAGALPQREPSEHYAVHDHAGEACARCGATVARISYADRDTFYCPGCQTGGKPLKDRRLSKLLR
ncbi:MAG TPA: DNA-formamidopyrimidine glycosylase family protein [Candidatus Eisenbacteria bacterium]|nr:DNA-formamidopyrimidine glycosylase family protein [Candidatus Eisenbacteria bacterium]